MSKESKAAIKQKKKKRKLAALEETLKSKKETEESGLLPHEGEAPIEELSESKKGKKKQGAEVLEIYPIDQPKKK